MKNLIVATPPAEYAVTRAEASLFMRYTGSLQNDVIDSLIIAAQKYCELWINRAVVSTTYEYYFDNFSTEMCLPIGNSTSITSIYYKNQSDSYTLLSTDVYQLDNKSLINKIINKYNQEFPEIDTVPNAVKVTFVAGWANAAAVPASIKTAIKIMVAQMFEHREGLTINELKENPTLKQLLATYATYQGV